MPRRQSTRQATSAPRPYPPTSSATSSAPGPSAQAVRPPTASRRARRHPTASSADYVPFSVGQNDPVYLLRKMEKTHDEYQAYLPAREEVRRGKQAAAAFVEGREESPDEKGEGGCDVEENGGGKLGDTTAWRPPDLAEMDVDGLEAYLASILAARTEAEEDATEAATELVRSEKTMQWADAEVARVQPRLVMAQLWEGRLDG